MKSVAYIQGALDALVKAGEVSPAFAAGVSDVLAKQAGFLWDSPGENFLQALTAYRKKHPGAWDPASHRLNISPEDAYDLINSSRIWWTGLPRRAGDYWGNRLRKWTRWWPGGDAMTAEDYDAELQDRRNRFMRDYVAEIRDELMGLPMGVEGALQDKFVGDAPASYRAARHHVDNVTLRTDYGKDADAYADKFRNRSGAAAMREGLYEPVYDIKTVTPASAIQSVHDDPRAYSFGDRGRASTFRAPRRRGLGDY